MDGDFLLALRLQAEWEAEDSRVEPIASSSSSPLPARPLSVVDEAWELLDPSPDVRGLFLQFNETLFWGRLAAVEVKWSPRMTLYGKSRAGGGQGPGGARGGRSEERRLLGRARRRKEGQGFLGQASPGKWDYCALRHCWFRFCFTGSLSRRNFGQRNSFCPCNNSVMYVRLLPHGF